MPDLSWWARLFGVLAVEAALVVGIATLLARATQRPQVQRLIWQASFLTVLATWFGELAGFRGYFGGSKLEGAEEVHSVRSLVVMPQRAPANPTDVTESSSANHSLDEEESRQNIPASAVSKPPPVYWPGALWLFGVGLLLAKTITAPLLLSVCVRQNRRRPIDRYEPGSDSALADAELAIARLSRQLGLRSVRLLVWPGLRSPVAFGIWRLTIALPPDFSRRFSAAQRDAMLAHELAHLAGRDPFWLIATEVAVALAWWHPAVWWARRQFRAACESAADEASALAPNGRATLAELLVSMGRELTAIGPARGLGVSGSGLRSELARRVSRLLAPTREWRSLPAGWRWLGTVSALLLAASLTMFPAAVAELESVPLGTLVGAMRSEVGRGNQGSVQDDGSAPRESDPLLTRVSHLNPDRLRPTIDSATAPEVLLEKVAKRMDQLPNRALGDFGGGRQLGANSPRPSAMLAPSPLPQIATVDSSVRSQAAAHLIQELRSIVPALRGGEVSLEESAVGPVQFPPQPLPAQESSRDQGVSTPQPPIQPPAKSVDVESPIVTLKIQFAEITAGGDDDIGLDWLFGQSPADNPEIQSGPATNLLTQPDVPKGENVRVDLLRIDGQSATLSSAQFAALRARLEGRPGVDFLSGPELTSVSGQAAQLAISEIRTVVTGVQATNGTPTQSAGVNYFVEEVEVGPVVDVVTTAERDAWRISIKARVTEFLGYDEPPSKKFVHVPDGQPMTFDEPLPRLRVRVIEAESRASMGETVALRGPLVVDTKKIKGGFLRRERIETTRKRLYVFVTPKSAEP